MLRPLAIACLLALALPARAGDASDDDKLLGLSLEQLGDVQVTATSRRATRLADTPASVYVIQGDDLRALGIRTLPEALRLAPNLNVAQINGAGYAVSARGLKTSLSNKLLVMIDGRTIYTPLFAGVLWDMQAVPIQDIDRVEVVSGPGAAAWGANAVNGVINIVTRPVQELDGGAARLWAAEDGRGAEVGQSFAAGGGAVRVYALRNERDRSSTSGGDRIPDGWTQNQAGLRGDWQRDADEFHLQADAYRADSSARALGPIRVTGQDVVGSWTRARSSDDQWSLQGYYDVVHRRDPAVLDDRMAIADLEFVRTQLHGAHRLTWGAGYRRARDEARPGALARLIPAGRTLQWGNVFVDDQIAVTGRLALDVGLRLDSNSYTGIEALPTARFSWTQRSGGLVWGALSRAVRTPARFDREFYFPASEPYFIRGGPQFDAEVADVAELGYRAQPLEWLSFSITGFHHWYDGLRGGAPAPEGGLYVANAVAGRVYGVEGWATARVAEAWEVSAGVLELRERLHLKPGFHGATTVADQGNDPEHQWLLRATRRIGQHQQVSGFARYVSALPAPAVPGYVQVDARWSWQPTGALEFGLGVRNLFDDRHAELQPADGLPQSEFGRVASADLRIDW
jgi:iron complex outermembrane receptor protein